MIADAGPVASPPALLAAVPLLPYQGAVLVCATYALAAVARLVVHEMRVEDAGPRRVTVRLHQPR